MALSNYGEQFAANCLRKFYARAIAPAITNQDYEGEIKKAGDRLNILSFLSDITLGDYSVGSDMSVQHPSDHEDQLVIDQKKYYNFDIDEVDSKFTYVEDEDSTLIENAEKVLEKTVDTFVLGKASEVKAGHRIGTDTTIAAANFAGLTSAGVLTVDVGSGINSNTIQGKGVYITELATWYKIKTWTDSSTFTIENWDDTAYADGAKSADYSSLVFEAADAVQVTATNVYSYLVELGEKLDDDEIPDTDRAIVVPAWFKSILLQASQLQPDIAVYHEEVVVNGKIGRAAGFDVHLAPGSRVSTSAGTDGVTGYEVLACHKSFITFGEKFKESRVVNAENQFAKKYQGLFLYGATVPVERRKAGAMLFCKQ